LGRAFILAGLADGRNGIWRQKFGRDAAGRSSGGRIRFSFLGFLGWGLVNELERKKTHMNEINEFGAFRTNRTDVPHSRLERYASVPF
jgi:hypothetical protein